MAKQLTADQKQALRVVGEAKRLIDVNAWTAAGSLIRHGLATKEPTVEPLSYPDEWRQRKSRAAYTLTAEGQAMYEMLFGVKTPEAQS